eukprot:422115-Amphidinium_carterae.1
MRQTAASVSPFVCPTFAKTMRTLRRVCAKDAQSIRVTGAEPARLPADRTANARGVAPCAHSKS